MAYTAIDDPSAFFQCSLYAGNAGTQTITHGGNSDLQADMVWLKGRNHAESTFVTDSVRGVDSQLYTNATNAVGTETNVVTAFGSDSFNIGNYSDINTNGKNYVSWNWKESATAGFDIVAYTGSGSAKTVSHSLSAIPKMIIVKSRSATGQWAVQHATLGPTKWTELQATTATDFSTAIWNDTAPTSSVFTVGTNARTNGNGTTYIAYCFAEKQGYSKFGFYTGNGNTNGTFVYTGFKAAFVLLRRTDSARDWLLHDSKRYPFNEPVAKILKPNSTGTEADTGNIDILSNGFKLLSTGTNSNVNGGNYIYMAFAESPFVTSGGVPTTAR